MNKNQQLANHQLEQLDTFVLAGVLTIFITRAYLAFTGYPQIGNSTLHVAHVLFGGAILTASFLYLLLATRPHKLLASLLGGIGFGLFIDEVGKFITQDNDYFYRPAIGIMYVSFLLIWFISRFIIVRGSKQSFLSPAEWPRQIWMRQLIVFWSSIQIILAGMTIGYSLAVNNDETMELLRITTVGIISAIIYSLAIIYGIHRYFKNDLLASAHIIRGATLFSIVALYPFFYFQYPLVSTLIVIPTLLVVLGLSETSVKQLLKKLLLQSSRS